MSRRLKVLNVALATLLVVSLPPIKTAIMDHAEARVDSWGKLSEPKVVSQFRDSIPVGRFGFVLTDLPVAKPITELPLGASAATGKVTLLAGYGDLPAKSHGCIPVCFINRSGRDIAVPHQDGDLFLKLEMRAADGKWVRCQPHNYSLCGNSYDPMPPLKDGHFYCVTGYQPRSGRRSLMRYAIHAPNATALVSNEFEGWYSTDDLEMALYDDMAFAEGDAPFLEGLLVCRIKPVLLSKSFDEVRFSAATALTWGRFPAHEAWERLSRVRHFDSAFKGFEYMTMNVLELRHKGHQNVAQ